MPNPPKASIRLSASDRSALYWRGLAVQFMDNHNVCVSIRDQVMRSFESTAKKLGGYQEAFDSIRRAICDQEGVE